MTSVTRRSRYMSLKARHRELRAGFPAALALRTHRALSWLDRAEREPKDHDARFLFLWIAFNAAYANEISERRTFTERRLLVTFMNRLVASDAQKLLYRMIWRDFSSSIRLLIDNRYVFQDYWDYRKNAISGDEWERRFARDKAAAYIALGQQDTHKVLAIIFDRLYTLRNQVVHGGSTWNSATNRSQVRDGARILGEIVPIVIHLMMEHPDQPWGEPCYPVVE